MLLADYLKTVNYCSPVTNCSGYSDVLSVNYNMGNMSVGQAITRFYTATACIIVCGVIVRLFLKL